MAKVTELIDIDVVENHAVVGVSADRIWWGNYFHYFALAYNCYAAAISFATDVIFAIGLNKIVDEVFGSAITDSLDDFWKAFLLVDWSFEQYLILLVALFVSMISGRAVVDGIGFFCSRRVRQVLRARLAESLLADGSDKKFSELLELTQHVDVVVNYLEFLKYYRFFDSFLIVFGLIFVMAIAPIFCLILSGCYALVGLVAVVTSKYFVFPRMQKIESQETVLAPLMQDIARMKDLIKLSGLSYPELERLYKEANQTNASTFHTALVLGVSQAFRSLVTYLTIPVLLIYGFYGISDANGLYQLIIVILCTYLFAISFEELSISADQHAKYTIAARELTSYIDTESIEFVFSTFPCLQKKQIRRNVSAVRSKKSELREGQEPSQDSQSGSEREGYITFQRVTVAFPAAHGQESVVLREISLSIEERERVAIIGETGSGKSTLLNVLLGFVVPTSGQVYINGEALFARHNLLSSWRNHIALVHQDSLMFKRSIRENICYGITDITEDALQAAITFACLDEWLNTLKDGLETRLVDREKQLSGGQRQRIQLARAVLSGRDVILMDEPTSSLDPDTKQTILCNLRPFFRGKTVVCVTHEYDMLTLFDRTLKLSPDSGISLANSNPLLKVLDAKEQSMSEDVQSVSSHRSFVLPHIASIRKLFGRRNSYEFDF